MAEPIAIAAQAEIPEEAAWFRATEAIGAVQTVLFVEDEAFVRGVASEVLRSAG
jgi:hypothetical protein